MKNTIVNEYWVANNSNQKISFNLTKILNELVLSMYMYTPLLDYFFSFEVNSSV